MAQRRMLDKKISVSESVGNLPIKAQLLFTWMIPHADDLGVIPSSPRIIKAMVVPMWDDSVEDIGILLEDIRRQGLIQLVSYGNKQFYLIKNFSDNQTLKRDRHPHSIMSIPLKKKAKESWIEAEKIIKKLTESNMEDSVFQTEDSVQKFLSEVNISKVKRREEEEPEESEKSSQSSRRNNYSKIESLTKEDFKEIADAYEVSDKFVQSKYDDMVNWKQSNGKSKKDWKATLRNWVKKDAEGYKAWLEKQPKVEYLEDVIASESTPEQWEEAAIRAGLKSP